MSAKVTLQVIGGPMSGREFPFAEHDTLLCGRMPDCAIHLPKDPKVSRYQFILEINPPAVRVRDLGSLNGTYVNGKKCGGRLPHETPDEGAQRSYPEVDLNHGDNVHVGDTTLTLHVECDPVCCNCGRRIPDKELEKRREPNGGYRCTSCQAEAPTSSHPAKSRQPGRPAHYDKAKKDHPPAQPPPLDDYQIERPLGTGAFGAVYLARHKKNNLSIAIKVMLAVGAVDDAARKRFLQEIQVLQGLRHPNIVSLLDYGSEAGTFYFIMEYCEGGSVRALLKQRGGTLPLPEASGIVLAALNGLASAHQKGFVHRDIKPENILLAAANDAHSAKLGDFGLAKNFDKAGFSGLTVTGSAGGTPFFMPREQVTNFKYVKPASDVWAMGATLYHMLTGHYPRDLRPNQDPIEAILNNPIVPIRERDSNMPAKLAEVIDRALANNISQRYENAAQMREALTDAL